VGTLCTLGWGLDIAVRDTLHAEDNGPRLPTHTLRHVTPVTPRRYPGTEPNKNRNYNRRYAEVSGRASNLFPGIPERCFRLEESRARPRRLVARGSRSPSCNVPDEEREQWRMIPADGNGLDLDVHLRVTTRGERAPLRLVVDAGDRQ